jgi:4-amino-4-deoxy-L-arabinose transferase-like glycosyltransferase
LFVVLLRLVFGALGVGVIQARAFSIFLGALTLPFVYDVARRIAGARAAVIAASVIWLMPASVMIQRNVQTDALLTLAMWGATAFWLASGEPGTSSRAPLLLAAAAGAAAGIAMLTKQNGVLVLAVLLIHEAWARGPRAVLSRRAGALVGAAALVALPWYGYALVAAGGHFISTQSGLAGLASKSGISVGFLTSTLGGELVWMLSAPLAVLGITGLLRAAARRDPGDKLLLAGAGVMTAFFIAFHAHSYYLYPALGFFALAAARLLDDLLSGRERDERWGLVALTALAFCTLMGPWEAVVILGLPAVALVVALVAAPAQALAPVRALVLAEAALVIAFLVLSTVLTMSMVKWGRTKFGDLASAMGGGRILLAPRLVTGNEAPAIRFAVPGIRLANKASELDPGELEDARLLVLPPASGQSVLPGEVPVTSSQVSVDVAGYRVKAVPVNLHRFRPSGFAVARGGSMLGLSADRAPVFSIVRFGDLASEDASRALGFVERY